MVIKDEPDNWIAVLFGRHIYGMIPEKETGLARVYLTLGLVIGFIIGTQI